MQKDSFNSTTTTLPNNSLPNRKPIFVTIQKSGNNIILAKPTITTAPPSQIPKLCVSSSHLKLGKLNGSHLKGLNNDDKKGDHTNPIQSNLINFYGARQTTVESYPNRLPLQQQLQHGPNKTYAPVNINFIQNRKMSIKHSIETSNENSSLKMRDYKGIAPESKAILKPKSKRNYKKTNPNVASGIPKYKFPLPPPKMNFTVSTNTVFNTAIDETTHDKEQIIPPTDTSMSSTCNETTNDQFNGVPNNCASFKKILIDLSKSKGYGIVTPVDAIDSKAPITSKELTASQTQDDTSETASSLPFLELHEIIGDIPADQPVTNQAVEANISPESEYGEIIKRLDRMEAMQLASSKRDAQILVAVKKLCLQYTKHNNDNDEIKKLLPIKDEIGLIEMDTRIIEDACFKEKFIAYIRGFKTTNDPDNFTALFTVLLADELVDQFNLKGIMGKKKLDGFKIMEIIQDLHKPMDKKTFEKIMRTTIELAKNRYHNELYRKRQQQKTKTSSSI